MWDHFVDRPEQLLGLAPLGSMQVLFIYMSLPLALSLLCHFAVVKFGLVATCSMLLLHSFVGLAAGLPQCAANFGSQIMLCMLGL